LKGEKFVEGCEVLRLILESVPFTFALEIVVGKEMELRFKFCDELGLSFEEIAFMDKSI
jgi:hypothetical protein